MVEIVKMYAGPMWSGKTTRLLEGLSEKDPSWCWVSHPRQTRRTERDIEVRFPRNEFSLGRDYDTIVFDEIHFWDVFGDGLAYLYWGERTREIRTAGIFHDCYSQFTPFSIWREMYDQFVCARADVEFHLLESVFNCARCGGDKGLYFSVPDGTTGERVGDSYVTVCSACSREWLEEQRR